MSSTSTTSSTLQKSMLFQLLLLVIFLALLAVNAVSCVRQRVEPLERHVLPARVTLAEGRGALVESSQRLVYVPEEASLLAGEEESLFPLHGIGALIGHVERVRAQIAVRRLGRVEKRLLMVAEFLQNPTALLHESLLEVSDHLLGHAPWLAGSTTGRHADHSRVRASRAVTPSRSTSARA